MSEKTKTNKKNPTTKKETPIKAEEPKTGTVVTVNTVETQKPQSVLALMSFISAFLFFIPLNNIISIILGHVALNDIKRNPNQEGAGLAKAGLIISYSLLGLALIALIVIGFFIMLSVLFAASVS